MTVNFAEGKEARGSCRTVSADFDLHFFSYVFDVDGLKLGCSLIPTEIKKRSSQQNLLLRRAKAGSTVAEAVPVSERMHTLFRAVATD